MIYCALTDIENYLLELNVMADSKEELVNEYPIHKILMVDNLCYVLLEKLETTWYHVSDFWTILSDDELDLQRLEKTLGAVDVESRHFNRIHEKISKITTDHLRSLQIKAVFEALIFNKKRALLYNKSAYDLVLKRL